MTVVSNMSPLHYLLLIDCIHILPGLYHRISVPPAVVGEMVAPGAPEAVRQWARSPPDWLAIIPPARSLDLPRLGSGRRGAGEKAAIALALELRADALFIDDRKGIQEARKLGLQTARTLSLIDRAAGVGLIEDLPSALDHLLHSTPFFAGKEVLRVVDDLLRRDEERRNRPPSTTA